jgi:IMP dehydrogenase
VVIVILVKILGEKYYMTIREGLCFDDVLLVPQHNKKINSRSEVSLQVKINNRVFNHPIIPANMKTIMSHHMAREIIHSGGLAILHRFLPLEEQLSLVKELSKITPSYLPLENQLMSSKDKFNGAVSLGVKEEDFQNAKKFIDLNVDMFCIDIAHGDSSQCTEMVMKLKEYHSGLLVIAGNVATGSGARRLWEAGADVVKVGVGPGSLCTTRIETGNGVPQLTALMDVYETQQELRNLYANKSPMNKFKFISDGGIKNAGDIVKALCFADMVMAGNLFAGCQETPGQVISIDGRQFKEYVGSSTHKVNHIEGVAALVPVKDKYQDILSKLLEGVRSGCSYQGVSNLQELKERPEFIRMTQAGLRESHPHDVVLK